MKQLKLTHRVMNWRWRDWRNSAVSLALLSAVFKALYLANDTYIMHTQIRSPNDSFLAVSVYLVLGGWIGTLCTLLYNKAFGSWLNTEYKGFSSGNRKMHALAAISGGIAALSTGFCLIGNQNLDASLVTALSEVSLIYILIYDLLRGKVHWKNVGFSLVLILMGTSLTAITNLETGLTVTVLGLVVLLGGRCATDALEQIFRQRGGDEVNPLVFNFWRFFWLSAIGTVGVFLVALIRGNVADLLNLIATDGVTALPWIFLTMFFVFGANTLYQMALKLGVLTKVNLIAKAQIVLGIPIALLGNLIAPGDFGNMEMDWKVWLIRGLGALLIVGGVALLQAKERRITSSTEKVPSYRNRATAE